jgi:type II secretory pathway component GspD/PulD (secretin)
MGKARRVVIGLLAAWLCLSALAAPTTSDDAQNPAWYSEPYAYVLVDQDVRSALEEFGRNLGLIVVQSDKVHGKSRNTVRAQTAGDFLTSLSDANGLTWYFDGNVLYINTDDEIGTRLFRAANMNLDQLQAYLSNLDVYGKQMSMRASPDGDELFVSGPPAYLTLVQQHIDHQQRPVAVQASRERGMRVFRGGVVTQENN